LYLYSYSSCRLGKGERGGLVTVGIVPIVVKDSYLGPTRGREPPEEGEGKGQ